MPDIVVSVINASSVVTDDQCRTLVAALQKQVSHDFAPVWGIDATLAFVPTGGTPAPGTWWLSILDNTDRAGVLGHHDLTPDGLPVGKSFAGTDQHYGHSWTVTASHELLEMLADPDINLTVFVHPEQGNDTLYAYEVCDACQDDSFGYDIDGVTVCDFVYPAYFQTFRQPGSTRLRPPGQAAEPGARSAGRRLYQCVRRERLDRMAPADRGNPRSRSQSCGDPRPHFQPAGAPAAATF